VVAVARARAVWFGGDRGGSRYVLAARQPKAVLGGLNRRRKSACMLDDKP
jgi:hypothetical protein